MRISEFANCEVNLYSKYLKINFRQKYFDPRASYVKPATRQTKSSPFEVGEVAEGLRDACRDVLVVFNLADVGNLDAMNLSLLENRYYLRYVSYGS